jgi:hypothetical protein
MKMVIQSGLAAIGLLALTAPATVVEAQTRSYPWCIFYDSSTYNCGFTSYQQCMATAQGGQGFCRPNPFVAPSGQQQRRSRRD